MTAQASEIDAQVVYLNGPRQLELLSERLPSGRVPAGQVLLETLVTAISPGTELAAYTGAPPLRPGRVYPRLQGYCNVARIMGIGEGVTGVSPGDRVLTFTSHRSHALVPADAVLCVVPPAVATDAAAPVYLFHLGYNAVLRSGIRAGSVVVVVGLGVLGLAAVAMARIAGATVFAVSDQPHPASLALRYGARAVFGREAAAELRAALGPRRADVVVTTTNGWDDWRLCLTLAGFRATVACLGFPGRGMGPASFNPLESEHFYDRQLRLEAVGLSPERADSRGFLRFDERSNLAYLLALVADGTLDPSAIVSGKVPGSLIETAYLNLLERKNACLTYLLQWNAD